VHVSEPPPTAVVDDPIEEEAFAVAAVVDELIEEEAFTVIVAVDELIDEEAFAVVLAVDELVDEAFDVPIDTVVDPGNRDTIVDPGNRGSTVGAAVGAGVAKTKLTDPPVGVGGAVVGAVGGAVGDAVGVPLLSSNTLIHTCPRSPSFMFRHAPELLFKSAAPAWANARVRVSACAECECVLRVGQGLTFP
jgi:hypothetical protein